MFISGGAVRRLGGSASTVAHCSELFSKLKVTRSSLSLECRECDAARLQLMIRAHTIVAVAALLCSSH